MAEEMNIVIPETGIAKLEFLKEVLPIYFGVMCKPDNTWKDQKEWICISCKTICEETAGTLSAPLKADHKKSQMDRLLKHLESKHSPECKQNIQNLRDRKRDGYP